MRTIREPSSCASRRPSIGLCLVTGCQSISESPFDAKWLKNHGFHAISDLPSKNHCFWREVNRLAYWQWAFLHLSDFFFQSSFALCVPLRLRAIVSSITSLRLPAVDAWPVMAELS